MVTLLFVFQKLAFMVSLGLVTHDHLEGEKPRLRRECREGSLPLNLIILIAEIQSKRQERKRRTTANPVYSGAVFEPEVQQESWPSAGT